MGGVRRGWAGPWVGDRAKGESSWTLSEDSEADFLRAHGNGCRPPVMVFCPGRGVGMNSMQLGKAGICSQAAGRGGQRLENH